MSVYITLCAVVSTMRRESVSTYIILGIVVLIVRRISVSAHITLCAVLFTLSHQGKLMRRISESVSVHIALGFSSKNNQ